MTSEQDLLERLSIWQGSSVGGDRGQEAAAPIMMKPKRGDPPNGTVQLRTAALAGVLSHICRRMGFCS